VRCMAAWTAGNLFTTTVEAARFAQELFSPQGRILKAHTRELYFSTPGTAWGFGNIDYGLSVMTKLPGSAIGGTGEGLRNGFGHFGIIIGAMSVVAYLPIADVSISVAVGDLRLSALYPNGTNMPHVTHMAQGSNLTTHTSNSTHNTSEVLPISGAIAEKENLLTSEFYGPISKPLNGDLRTSFSWQKSMLKATEVNHEKDGWRKWEDQKEVLIAGKMWKGQNNLDNQQWEDTLETWVSPSADDLSDYIKFQAMNALGMIKVILKATIVI